jgi:hypothetical protein
MDVTARLHQILCKSRKSATETLAMSRKAIHGCLNGMLGSGQTKNAETGEEHVHNFL